MAGAAPLGSASVAQSTLISLRSVVGVEVHVLVVQKQITSRHDDGMCLCAMQTMLVVKNTVHASV